MLGGITIADKLKPESKELRKVFTLYAQVRDLQQEVENFLNKINEGGKLNIADFNSYAAGLIGIVEGGLAIVKSLDPNFKDEGVETAIDAIQKVLTLTELLTKDNAKNIDYEQVIATTLNILQDYVVDDEVKKIFAKYGAFAAELINADSSSAALAALENVALPVESYRIKRRYPMDISLNAYPGLFAALETLTADEVEKEDIDDVGGVFGFTAPVGLAFSFSKGKRSLEKNKQYGVFTVFASIIDLGALVSFRLQDDVSLLPELSYKNVFAPGGYVLYGLKNNPITLGFGFQYGPELRQVTKDNLDIESRAWRVGISATVDIPVFRFFTKGQKDD